MGKCYLVHLGYDGGNYYGWQRQPGVPTVQETFYQSLGKLFPNGKVKVFAAGRTDRGVHALGQVVKLDLPSRQGPLELLDSINNILPPDIRVFDCRRIAPSFKVTDYVMSKEYWYFFNSMKFKNERIVTIEEELDVAAMAHACQYFVGTHDFTHYQYRSTVKGNFIREILECEIVQFSNEENEKNNIWQLRIKGSGFLKQMVRLIAGALINRGLGKITDEDLISSLKQDGRPVGFIAPANGLYLHTIHYPYFEALADRQIVDRGLWSESGPPWAPRLLSQR